MTRIQTVDPADAALCHRLASLIDIQARDADDLVDDERLTGFSLAADQFAEQTLGGVQVFEWYVQPALEARGAKDVDQSLWADVAIADGNLITGQQQYSGVARQLEALER